MKLFVIRLCSHAVFKLLRNVCTLTLKFTPCNCSFALKTLRSTLQFVTFKQRKKRPSVCVCVLLLNYTVVFVVSLCTKQLLALHQHRGVSPYDISLLILHFYHERNGVVWIKFQVFATRLPYVVLVIIIIHPGEILCKNGVGMGRGWGY